MSCLLDFFGHSSTLHVEHVETMISCHQSELLGECLCHNDVTRNHEKFSLFHSGVSGRIKQVIWGFPARHGGTQELDGLFHGKSQPKMDVWGVPPFQGTTIWKTPRPWPRTWQRLTGNPQMKLWSPNPMIFSSCHILGLQAALTFVKPYSVVQTHLVCHM